MNNKEIVNIVFYTTQGGELTARLATIFYSDGTIVNGSFEDGIDACEEIVKARNIQTKDAFKEMINTDMVHVMSESEFRERFNSFVPRIPPMVDPNSDERDREPFDEEDFAAEEDADVEEEADERRPFVDEIEPSDDDFEDIYSSSEDEEEAERQRFSDDDGDYDDSDDYDGEIEDDELDQEEPVKKEGFFKRAWNKIRKSKVVKAVIACVTSLAIACGIYSCAKRKTIEGEMANSNLSSITKTADTNDQSVVLLSDEAFSNDHFYDDAAIKGLFDKTTNETQKTAMYNIGTAMDGFNNVFAYHYQEDGKDIIPSLKYDEVVSLQLAYNDYSREQLVAILNGADIKSADLSRAYKDANLQLMGAYAIENEEHPVDMSMLIESQEGKDFYKKYHEAFLKAKSATGDEKIRLATDFYKMVRKDFPINQKERTEGISHSENYETITAYKFAVTPMIAAAEMMWQNLETDVTLDDMEIDFLNDLGLCNYADKTFERAELLSLSNPVDNNNPTFQEYKDAFIKFYKDHDMYYIDDEHRELTKLQAFQDAVNWHFEMDAEANYQGSTTTSTETRQETKTWTETRTTYSEEVETTEKPITDEARREVDAELEAENEAARKKAEEEAEAERRRLQQEEDENARRVEEEVKKDKQDLQDKIDDANRTIDQNNSDNDKSNDKPVNESDLGHGVDFDDEHSDQDGNLDSSVHNITSDPTGDKTNDPLPDPNETGREFDARVNSSNGTTTKETPTSSNDGQDQWVESVPVDDDYYYEDAWVEYEDDVDYSAAIEAYVDSLGSDTSEATAGYQYRR